MEEPCAHAHASTPRTPDSMAALCHAPAVPPISHYREKAKTGAPQLKERRLHALGLLLPRNHWKAAAVVAFRTAAARGASNAISFAGVASRGG